MQRGILRHFRGARNMFYGPSTSLSPAHNCFCHCFDVLKAIENITEDALKGGSFYFPERFPF
jgi:hypothetical protein